jgi:hypothetical protein
VASSRWSLKLLIHSCLPLPMVTAASVAPLADVAVCRSQAPQSPSSIQTLQANLLLTPTSEVDCVARVHRSARTHRSHSMSHSVELHEPKSSMPQRRRTRAKRPARTASSSSASTARGRRTSSPCARSTSTPRRIACAWSCGTRFSDWRLSRRTKPVRAAPLRTPVRSEVL